MRQWDREVDMSQYELPDDEPLSDAEMARLDVQRDRSRAVLANRAASRRMTPMEMFASGAVHGEMPNDRLAYDQSRQLPSPEVHQEVKSGGEAYVPEESQRRAVPNPTSERMRDWLKKDQGRSFKAGWDDYFDRGKTPPGMGAPMPEPEADDDEDIVDAEFVEEAVTYEAPPAVQPPA